MKKYILCLVAMLCCMAGWADTTKDAAFIYDLEPVLHEAYIVDVATSANAGKVVTVPQAIRYNNVNYTVAGIKKAPGIGGIKYEGTGLRFIGEAAFRNSAILSVDIYCPAFQSVERQAFQNCQQLTKVRITKDNTNAATKFNAYFNFNGSIADAAFNNCAGITGIRATETTTKIGSLAFADCANLTIANFYCPTAGEKAFRNCTKLTDVTSYATDFENYVFEGCSALANVNLSRAERFQIGVLKGTAITVFESATLQDVGPETFMGCSSLQSVRLTATDCEVGYSAFEGCAALTSALMPSLKTLGKRAFYGCSRLTAVNLGDRIECLHAETFSGCSSLASLTLPATIEGYYSQPGLPADALAGCTALASLSMGSNVYIRNGDHPLADCPLTSVTLRSGMTTFAEAFFKDIKTLTTVSLPATLTTIPKEAFSGCSALTTINFDALPKTAAIEVSAFKNCSALTAVTLRVKKVGYMAFEGCSGLTSADITASEIGAKTFSGCTALKTLTLDVPALGSHAFEGCSQLTTTTLNQKPTTSNSFSGCTGTLVLNFDYGPYTSTNNFSSNCPLAQSRFSALELHSAHVPNALGKYGLYLERIDIYDATAYDMNFSSMLVDDAHPHDINLYNCANYKSVDGLVFSTDGTKLEGIPYSRTKVVLSATTRFIGQDMDRTLCRVIDVRNCTQTVLMNYRSDSSSKFEGVIIATAEQEKAYQQAYPKARIVVQRTNNDVSGDGNVSIVDLVKVIDAAQQ